jgi:hypothetical protein
MMGEQVLLEFIHLVVVEQGQPVVLLLQVLVL